MRSPEPRLRFAGPALLALPCLALVVFGYIALGSGAGAERLRLAPQNDGRTFHPVAGRFRPDGTGLEECSGDYACLEQSFGNIAFHRGPRVALTLFDERMAEDERVLANCHRIVHTIGSAALARYHGNVSRTFARGSSTCASGYYHGVLERVFSGASSLEALARRARSVCSSQSLRPRGFLYYQCVHGLGHGLMIQTGYDLPVALSVCAKIRTPWDEVSCAGGAFMENTVTRFGYRSRWLSDEDPLHPCGVVAERNRGSCYLRASDRALALNGHDWRATAEVCASVDRRWLDSCFRGFGRNAVGPGRRGMLGKVHQRCRLVRKGQGDCYFGAARTVIDRSGSNGMEVAASLCRGAPEASKALCFSGVGVVIGLLQPTPAARALKCAEVTRRYAAVCAAAAAAEVDPDSRDVWG